MENLDFSVLTGASLIPPTKNKILLFFLMYQFVFRTDASLDLKYHIKNLLDYLPLQNPCIV